MHHRLTRAALGAAATLTLLLAATVAVVAQSPAPAPVTYRGEIEKTGATPTVMVNGQERPLTAGANATILRGDKAVQLADLKKGDAVTVTTNPDGSAARVEAIPDDNGGFKWWYLLPLLLLLLIPLFLRRKKKKDDFVLESDRGSTSGPR